MVRVSVLNDALKSMYNAEKRGKRQFIDQAFIQGHHQVPYRYAEARALSWFSVGCYYYCIKKYDQSRRYFSKATKVDGNFPPAWIGYGNAYSAQDEGDQAMSIYRTSARLFPGCHLPTLYIGMEYMRTHSYKLAEQGTLNDGRVIAVKQLSAAS